MKADNALASLAFTAVFIYLMHVIAVATENVVAEFLFSLGIIVLGVLVMVTLTTALYAIERTFRDVKAIRESTGFVEQLLRLADEDANRTAEQEGRLVLFTKTSEAEHRASMARLRDR